MTVYEDAGVHQIWVLNNETEPEGDPLSIAAMGTASHGEVSIEHPVTGTLLYTPEAGYLGPDAFTYTVSDGLYEVDATVNVTVNPINDPPVAAPDTFDVAEDSSANLLTVLANDNDVDGDTLTLSGVGRPEHGIAYFQPDPDDGGLAAQALSAFTVITYTPDLNFFGTDVFAYTVSDGVVEVESTVTVTVQAGPNDRPEAQNNFFTRGRGCVDAPLDVLANDPDPEGDPLSVSLVDARRPMAAPPPRPTASPSSTRPTPASPTTTAWSTKSTDGSLTVTATVRIRRAAGQQPPPAAEDDAFTVDADSSGNALTVLANDGDPDGDILLIAPWARPPGRSDGELNPLRTALLYTPPPGAAAATPSPTPSATAARRTATVNVTMNADTSIADLSLRRSVEPASWPRTSRRR